MCVWIHFSFSGHILRSWRRWNAKSTRQNLIRSSWNLVTCSPLLLENSTTSCVSIVFNKTAEQPASDVSERGKMGLTRRLFFAGPRGEREERMCVMFDSLAQVEWERKSKEKSPPFTPQLAPIYSFSTPRVCLFLPCCCRSSFARQPQEMRFSFSLLIFYETRRAALMEIEIILGDSHLRWLRFHLWPQPALSVPAAVAFSLYRRTKGHFFILYISHSTTFLFCRAIKMSQRKCALRCAHVHWIRERYFPRYRDLRDLTQISSLAGTHK